jgi:hypothetical protein
VAASRRPNSTQPTVIAAGYSDGSHFPFYLSYLGWKVKDANGMQTTEIESIRPFVGECELERVMGGPQVHEELSVECGRRVQILSDFCTEVLKSYR